MTKFDEFGLPEPTEYPPMPSLVRMNEQIKKQIELLEEEQRRVKIFINENNFDCTTAPWVIVKRYRDELKAHIKILKMNLED
jgi:DNA integrity scanning protein DisA with diadenylate cyclase activity